MFKRLHLIFLLVICGISFALIPLVEALVTFPDPVPNNVLPDDAQLLKGMYEHLKKIGNDLEKRLTLHNAQCRQVKAGSAEEERCVKNKTQLDKDWGDYEKMREKYNQKVKLAIQANKVMRSSISVTPQKVSPAPGPAGPARAGSVANAKRPEVGPAKAGPVANSKVHPSVTTPNR